MKTAVRWLATLFVAFSVGTVVSLTVLGGTLWWKGAFSDDRVMGMLAVLSGVQTPAAGAAAAGDGIADEQPSLDQIMQRRLAASLDLDLRETAIDKALGELRNLEAEVKVENKRLDDWKVSFDKRLETLESETTDEALFQLQRTIEVMNPKQAKDQILKMLAEPATAADDPMRDVVTILKTMPADKQKKLIGEFKLEPEAEKLAEILKQIRLGSPDADLIRDTRNQLQQQLTPPR
jgi:hypothetical protein